MENKKEFTMTFTKVGDVIQITQTDSPFSSIELIGLLTLAISNIEDDARSQYKQEEKCDT